MKLKLQYSQIIALLLYNHLAITKYDFGQNENKIISC